MRICVFKSSEDEESMDIDQSQNSSDWETIKFWIKVLIINHPDFFNLRFKKLSTELESVTGCSMKISK